MAVDTESEYRMVVVILAFMEEAIQVVTPVSLVESILAITTVPGMLLDPTIIMVTIGHIIEEAIGCPAIGQRCAITTGAEWYGYRDITGNQCLAGS